MTVKNNEPTQSTEPDPDSPAGWRTMKDGSHQVITRREADAILAKMDADRAERAERLPTEKAAIHAMFDAFDRLRELGWSEAVYCPKDGSSFDVIEAGSTGIHPCFYSGEWPTGYFMVGEGFDCGPSRPILFKLRPEAQAKHDAKMAEAKARYQASREQADVN